jgi:hypothetical protein
MTAAAARSRPSSKAQLALKSESITTPAKMGMSATTNTTRRGPALERGPGAAGPSLLMLSTSSYATTLTPLL